VVFETKVRPDKIEGARAAGLDVPGRHTIDLLLEYDAGEDGHHYGRGFTPPGFMDNIKQTLVLDFHAFLEAGDPAGNFVLGLGISTRRNHGGMPMLVVHA